jgi:predicted NUDIX family NTP pyrophosphohydrolase
MNKSSKIARTKFSAGLIMFQNGLSGYKYFLVHPGGPFWKNKELGAWSIPKGEFTPDEDKLQTAIREFNEETGMNAIGEFIDLGSIKQKSGKTVFAWAFEGEFNGNFKCESMCDIEYPPKSGKIIQIPEVDKGNMFTRDEAEKLMNSAQFEFIERLEKILAGK